MANPFPGMDPYLEQQWGDAHARIIVYASDQLLDVLPAGLKSRIESGCSWIRRPTASGNAGPFQTSASWSTFESPRPVRMSTAELRRSSRFW